MVPHFPAAAPHPPQNTFSPCPDPLGKEFFRKRKFPPAQPPRQNNKGNKSRGSEEKRVRRGQGKKKSKNCNVSRLRCQCNHRRCRQPLAASSFTRSPRPPLLGSRRSITSLLHSTLCSRRRHPAPGTQLDAEPAPPSHTPAETQSRTSRSFFLHTIPATLSSALAASASRCSHTQAGHLQSRDNLPPSISSPVSARRVPAQHSTTRNARTQHTARDAEH